MDLRPIHPQEATSSSSASAAQQDHPDHSLSTSSESRAIRSSARVKAAKQKLQINGKNKDREPPNPEQLIGSSSTAPAESSTTRSRPSPIKLSRSKEANQGKGKAKESSQEISSRSTKRPRRNPPSISVPLTINEPVRDPKGKKRAAPEPEEEDLSGPSTKRPRTFAYSLRSFTASTHSTEMPRKPRNSASKGKTALKTKMAAASSSKLENEDVDMLDADYSKHDESDQGEPLKEKVEANGVGQDDPAKGDDKAVQGIEAMDEDEDDDDDDDDEGDGDNGHGEEGRIPSSDAGPIPGGMDEPTALAIFGDYRQFGSYMMSLSSRLKTMLNNIKSTADPTTRLLTLQELSELLSISTEDTLAGSFQVEQFVRELVKILGGRGADDDDDDDNDGETGAQDEDAALAAALAMSTGGAYRGDENLEAQVLACRCLANLMEALPGVAHTVVYHGAIPVLCSKLIEISYIDLAEQTLSTMEKISEEFPSAIVREGGLAALLNYLDFFSIAVQRTALQAASNCCRNVSIEHFPMIRGVWPIIRNCLAYSDQRLVEFACLCVIRIIDSYHRASVENLETLMDTDMIKAVNQLLLPAGGSPLVAANTYTLLLRALATSARASAKITVALLEADIVDTLYQILTGVLPSASENHLDQGDATGGQGLGGGLADMTVMENLAHRPKDQVEEALGLVSELLPPLPKDGVFDHKGYTEKSLARMVKAKAKAERAAARLAAHAQSKATDSESPSTTPTVPVEREGSPVPGPMDPLSQEGEEAAETAGNSEVAPDRTEMLRSKPTVVGMFMQLLVPILIDVYAASVITPVRIKTLTGLLKAVSFLDGDGIKRVLAFVPVASFSSSILSSKDHPSLVIGALQLVDMLLSKAPSLYKPTFRREGVFHEIEFLAERTLTTAKSKDREASETGDDAPPANPSATVSGLKKISSLSLDPEDAITLRARVIQFKHLSEKEDPGEDGAFQSLTKVVERISASNASDQEYLEALWELAELFASPHTSVSSFELLKSGVVDGLLQFATDDNRKVSLQRRKEILLDALTSRKVKALGPGQTPFATLVKKLQESLTRMESFDVITVTQNSDESKRSSPSLLARQLRLRLVAGDESDIPRNLHNIVVSIHAIATFQALHDYLRPRVAGLLSGSSRLSGMFAALAASGFVGSSSKPPGQDGTTPSKTSTSTVAEGTVESSSAAATSPSVPTVQRRRSQRLSAKAAAASPSTENLQDTPASVATAPLHETLIPDIPPTVDPPPSTAQMEPAPSDTVVDSELQADFTDDEEVDAEVFDEDVDPETSVSEKTITVSVAEDGTQIEAQTPDGTRVATPSAASMGGSAETAPGALSSRASYASALKAKPTDWHLEFSMDDHVLPLDLTIYGAIHQHEMRKKIGATPLNMIWQGVYTIKFKKILGPAPGPETRGDDSGTKLRSPSPTLSSLPEDSPHAKILRLLRVIFHLNTSEAERVGFVADRRNLPDSAFVNNKLTAKLTRQLEEPMIVASSCLPDWALDLPQHFPFLFPFATRYNFLQSTSFGYARLILKWQSQQTRGQDNSRRDDGIGFLGRLQRQKVRISRKHVLESAVKVFELYGSSSSILEVEYFEEVGTGLGPTLEFYSLVSKEFARKDLKLWRDFDASGPGVYVDHPNGLYPAPISGEDISHDGGQKRTHIFRVIGQFLAKAMLDSRIIDLSFNKIFLKLALGEEVPLTIASLKLVDMDLAKSLVHVQNLALDAASVPNDKLSQKVAKIEKVSIEDLALDFTIPGYDIELRPGGRDMSVTSENVQEYVSEVLEAILGKGVSMQVKAFREGFSKVFPIGDLRAFSSDELVILFGNSDEDWSSETLSEALKADHGFNVESRAIRDLIDIMSEYNQSTRRAYLQFITGSPKLPIGGFRGLNPPLTVVRKPHEAPMTADDYLPSVMTCVNYLKLPEYSTKQVMKTKLHLAMQEGVGSFHLS